MWEPPTDRSVPSPDTSEEGFEVTAFEPTSRLEVERPASPGQHIGTPRPRCTPQTSTIKITKAMPSGISHVHGYGS